MNRDDKIRKMRKSVFSNCFRPLPHLLLLFASFSAMAADWSGWEIYKNPKLTESRIRIEDGNLQATLNPGAGKREFRDLSITKPLSLEPGKQYTLEAVIEAEQAGEAAIIYKHHAPYKTLGLSMVKKLLPGKNLIIHKFRPEECPPGKTSLLTIACGRINGKITITDFAIKPGRGTKVSCKILSDEWNAEFRGQTKKVKLRNGAIDFRPLFGKQPTRAEALLTQTFHSEATGTMRLGLSADWWMEVETNGKRVFSTLKTGNKGPQSPKTNFADIPVQRGENTVRIRILAGSKGWSFTCGEPTAAIVPEETENWWSRSVPVKNTVVEGSALDLSGIVPADRINTRIVYSSKAGAYAYEDEPDKPVRLFAAESMPWQIFLGRKFIRSEEEAKKEIDAWVRSLRRRGYAAVRMHTLDGIICYLSKEDMELDPKAFDRVMYSFYRFKEAGIRLHLTILAYNLYSERKHAGEVFADRSPHKIGFMFLNEFECERFRFGAEKLLNTVNPYTKMRLADDPMLLSVELYNEMEVGADFVFSFYHWNRNPRFAPLQEKIGEAWKSFLKRRNLPLRPVPKRIESGGRNSPDETLFLEFCSEQLDRSYRWGEKVLRDLGWKGAIVQNSQSKRIVYGSSRWRCSNTVEAHGYFAHPSRFTGKGSQNYQRSSVEGLAEQFRSINSVRQYGRAFQTGEFNHAFWNRWIHEGGIVYPALAAFQGHQAIAYFASPYNMRHSGISCFEIAENPVMAANGFLGAVLFGRGDIRPAKHQGVLNIPNSYLKQGTNAYFPINSEQSKIALMTGFSIAFPDQPAAEGTAYPRKPDFELTPANHGFVNSFEWTSNLRDVNDGSFDLAGYVAKLKKQGILPADNVSDPAKGVFQTDTGEITMNGPEKWMTVITARTEAITWTGKPAKKLGNLTVLSGTSPATVAASAVDGKNLENSSRIVLICATEAINSGMELSEDWTTLFSVGALPVLVRSGTFTAELLVKPGNWKLYALGLDGERLEELPLENVGGKLKIQLNTAALKNGVTPFFELCRDER